MMFLFTRLMMWTLMGGSLNASMRRSIGRVMDSRLARSTQRNTFQAGSGCLELSLRRLLPSSFPTSSNSVSEEELQLMSTGHSSRGITRKRPRALSH